MQLYKINQALRELTLDLDPEHDLNHLTAAIEELKIERKEKIESICCIIKEKIALARALKQEANDLAERSKATERQTEHLKEYLKICLAPREKFESSKAKISWRKSTAVQIDNELLIEDDFIVREWTQKIDKKAITEALKEGRRVTGAHLEERENLQIK